ncbi:MAG TPA: DUF58 domain-containing protein [Pyrinomonadaceae bacterium]|nr:DUF58 domain-containing protein [Pyrinomonadaceae bacterium]
MKKATDDAAQIRNPQSEIRNTFSRWRNTILGTLLVLGGVATAFFTIFARHLGEPNLAGTGAIASLIFALLITILVVPPLARSAYLEVANRGLPLEVTAGGVIFIIILVVVALAAWNTGNNLLFLVFSIMLSTLFVSWAAARLTLRELTVAARFPDHIFAGEPTEVLVTIRNEKRVLPSFSVLVEARGPADRKARKKTRRSRFLKRTLAYFTYIPHRAAAEQTIEQLFRKRGHVLVTGFELSTRFPFGFFRHRRRLRSREVDIVVYPKPQPVADEFHLLPLFTGQAASFRRGFGHDLLMLRDYQQRDDLRHIDWKATARARRLTVREFSAEDERRITILLDTRLTEDIDQENFRIRFENGVVQAASLVKHFIDERAEVSLASGGETTGFGTGLEHLYTCLRKLALVQPDREASGDRELERMVDAATARDGRGGDTNYLIILTASVRGNIPPNVWRRGYVVFL